MQQINAFVVDIDSKASTPGEIVLAAMDKELGMPTLILESTKGYQVYFVLDKPSYVTNKYDYRCLAVAKRISENIRKALSEILPDVDHACNHFGFFRMPNEENIVHFDEESCVNFGELIAWSIDQDVAHRRNLFTVFTNNQGRSLQISDKWVEQVISCTEIKGKKGVIGRDNTVFTLALACFASGKSQGDTYDLLDEYNSKLDYPLKDKEIQKVIRSAFSGKYKGANKAHIENILETWTNVSIPVSSFNTPNGWYKHKKDREDRER
ncbi:primase C-terminal domain-containing protein, partial [Bacillus velezensis]|uniref:primase C-terminal domain-containing protein n=1 Tax=Bacillus velezensis TaxID=492670 RepID=UPI002FFEF82A